jgi:hypothetical protein
MTDIRGHAKRLDAATKQQPAVVDTYYRFHCPLLVADPSLRYAVSDLGEDEEIR